MYVEVIVDPDFAVVPSSFAIVAEGVEAGTRSIHEQALRKLYSQAQKNFSARIERPKFSATRGGTVYRPESRATGTFTFGPNGAFRGNLISNGPVQGLSFPDESHADAATKGAWRALEFGTASVTMPVGYWRDAGGSRVPPGQGGDDELVPGSRKMVEVGGIDAKEFISDAVYTVADDIEKAYQRLADEVARDAVTHSVPGQYREVTRTIYVDQRVSGYTTKTGRVVESYIRRVPRTITELELID